MKSTMDAPQASEQFERIHFESADELLRSIAPIPLLDTETITPEFIFRGQRDERWELIPNALRLDSTGKTKAATLLMPSSPDRTEEFQALVEFRLLRSFMEACDRASIALSEDSLEFRKTWMDDQKDPMAGMYRRPSMWPAPQHLPLLAVAQHHGIPTQLLDWTRSATVAAYFAAADAAATSTQGDKSGNLAIWALNVEFLHLYPEIELIEMPGANSQRLGAQRGLFTIVRRARKRGAVTESTSLADALVSRNEAISKTKPLWKLTLPKAEALHLLYLCHLNGVDAGTVYPGIEGAARATLERAAWQRADPETGLSAAKRNPIELTKLKSQRHRE